MKKVFLFSIFSWCLLSFSQVTQQDVDRFKGTATGTDTYSVTISDITSLVPYDGQKIWVKFTNANTGAATIVITIKNGVNYTARAITLTGAALSANDLIANQYVGLVYYLAGTSWQLQKNGTSAGSGTVTSFTVTPNQGVSGAVANPSTTPNWTPILGAITPSVSVTSPMSSFSVSTTTPLVIGGSSTTQALTYKTTTGVGTTNADHVFQVGNNGGTEALRILNSGLIGIGTSIPTQRLQIQGSAGVGTTIYINTTSGSPGVILGDNTTLASSSNDVMYAMSSGSNIFAAGTLLGDAVISSQADRIVFIGGASHSGSGTIRGMLTSTGLAIGKGSVAPTARLNISAGSTSISPINFTSGSLPTGGNIVAGNFDFLTDKWYGTITTGPAQKEITMNDAALTPGTTPVATINGRLTDGLILASGTYSCSIANTTNVDASSININTVYTKIGGTVIAEYSINVDPTTTLTQTRIDVSLPLTANPSGSSIGQGVFFENTTTNNAAAYVVAVDGTHVAAIFTPISTATHVLNFTVMYVSN